MKIITMKIMTMTSSIIFLMKSPMSMGILLLLQTMMSIILMNFISNTSWFTMITFLMMIGGLLILFTYMSSIASNEKFKLKFNLTLVLLVMLILLDQMILNTQMNDNLMMNYTQNMELSMMKMYNIKSMIMTMIMIMYLLLTMISVTKIVKHHKGPLRAFNKYEKYKSTCTKK